MTDAPAPAPRPGVATTDDIALTTVGVLFRQFSILGPGLVAVLGFLSRRDIVGLVAWAQSVPAKAPLAAAWTIAAILYGLRHSIRAKLDLLFVARSTRVPDDIARVTPGRLSRAWAVLRGRA